jgi:hypothetical protein
MRSKRGTSRISNGSADHYTYFKIIIQKVWVKSHWSSMKIAGTGIDYVQ